MVFMPRAGSGEFERAYIPRRWGELETGTLAEMSR